MNERIRELALQAGLVKILEEHAHEYGAGTFENTPYPELEKFAELILLDVRLLIADGRIENDNPVVDDVLVSVLISIEKHFGVEE